MTDTIMVNGVAVPIDELDGPVGDKLTAAYRRHRANHAHPPVGACGQGSHARFVGTPRLRKHKGDSVLGVRFK